MLLQDDATVVAVLAIIGGADNRVRLGGTVENEDYGKGIVTRITRSGRICVQSCSDEQVIRNTPLSLWKVVRNSFDRFLFLYQFGGGISAKVGQTIFTIFRDRGCPRLFLKIMFAGGVPKAIQRCNSS